MAKLELETYEELFESVKACLRGGRTLSVTMSGVSGLYAVSIAGEGASIQARSMSLDSALAEVLGAAIVADQAEES